MKAMIDGFWTSLSTDIFFLWFQTTGNAWPFLDARIFIDTDDHGSTCKSLSFKKDRQDKQSRTMYDLSTFVFNIIRAPLSLGLKNLQGMTEQGPKDEWYLACTSLDAAAGTDHDLLSLCLWKNANVTTSSSGSSDLFFLIANLGVSVDRLSFERRRVASRLASPLSPGSRQKPSPLGREGDYLDEVLVWWFEGSMFGLCDFLWFRDVWCVGCHTFERWVVLVSMCRLMVLMFPFFLAHRSKKVFVGWKKRGLRVEWFRVFSEGSEEQHESRPVELLPLGWRFSLTLLLFAFAEALWMGEGIRWGLCWPRIGWRFITWVSPKKPAFSFSGGDKKPLESNNMQKRPKWVFWNCFY